MKLIKRRTKMVFKEVTDLEWQRAYTRYLEICLLRPNQPKYNGLEDFKMFCATIWRPIPGVELPVETEEEFITRVTKVEKKEQFLSLQFIPNQHGEVVSCILF
jgi:hypothetical protein